MDLFIWVCLLLWYLSFRSLSMWRTCVYKKCIRALSYVHWFLVCTCMPQHQNLAFRRVSSGTRLVYETDLVNTTCEYSISPKTQLKNAICYIQTPIVKISVCSHGNRVHVLYQYMYLHTCILHTGLYCAFFGLRWVRNPKGKHFKFTFYWYYDQFLRKHFHIL